MVVVINVSGDLRHSALKISSFKATERVFVRGAMLAFLASRKHRPDYDSVARLADIAHQSNAASMIVAGYSR